MRSFARSIPPGIPAVVLAAALLGLLFAGAAAHTPVRFASFGDYYGAGADVARVRDLVAGAGCDLVVTVGDNGATTDLDNEVGQFYHTFIHYPAGSASAYAASGSPINRFFPALGNHDWDPGLASWYDYFELPGNERAYETAWGPVRFFVLSSDAQEPDGITSASLQAQWLQARLAAATEPWKIVVCHHPPYSSGAVHGNTPELQWPFEAWGASAVLAGHDHTYERILKDGFPYIVVGTGGRSLYAFNPTPEPGSEVRYSADYGALIAEATDTSLTFRFFAAGAGPPGVLIDTFTMTQPLHAGGAWAEDFDAFPVDQRVGAHPDWFDGDTGPYVRAANGVAATQGLEDASGIFTWSAHPFVWSDASLERAVFALDFQAGPGGSAPQFDDDRIGWMTTDSDINSDYFFGIQLDPVVDPNTGLNIESYWRNAADERVAVSMADVPALTAGQWYRLHLDVARLGPTSARLDAYLHELDATGAMGPLVAAGSIENTGDILPETNRPAVRYFTSPSAFPAYKNYSNIAAAADNAYAEIVTTGTPASGLVAHWAFEEGSGTAARDSSAYANDGVVAGASWTSGRIGGALAFNAASARVEVPDSPSLRSFTTQFSFSAWVYPTAASSDWSTILQRSRADGAWFDWQVYARAEDASVPYAPVLRFDWDGDLVVDPDEEVSAAAPLAAGTWYHLAGTYDGTDLKLFVDGSLSGTTNRPDGTIPGSAKPVWIGGNDIWGEWFEGTLDEVRLYNRALSPEEVWALAHPGAPPEIVMVSPADGALDVPIAPDLCVTVTDPEADTLSVTFHGRAAAGQDPGPDFTLIGLPDTQFYTSVMNGGSPALFSAQTRWIVSQTAARNVAFVQQFGDLSQNGDNSGDPIEWVRGDSIMAVLEDPLTTGLPEGLPFGISIGNHDQTPGGDAAGTTLFYNQYFGEARFAGRDYYGGHFGANNDNHFELFSASGLDFIVISMEYDTAPDAAVLAWADSLLTAHASRRAIVGAHNLIGTGNPGAWSSQGQAVYNALRDHGNLFLMLCGHTSGEGRRTDTYDGHTVHTVLADYQSRTNGGNGWLRLFEFSPANNVIRVKTYSPVLGQWETDSDSEFTLPYEMSGTEEWAPVATVTHVASGSEVCVPWAGRSPMTQYEWYASAHDGQNTTNGPVWSFTTVDLPTLTVNVVGQGAVTKDPDLTGYAPGTPVELTAAPEPGWAFDAWSGDVTGSANPETLVIAGDASVTATFVPTGSYVTWTAYNDCIYDASTNYIAPHVTTFGIGAGYSGPTSGPLLDRTAGAPTGATAALTQTGGVNWQPSAETGGHDPAEGTDARQTFGGIADMAGVIYYGTAGWTVDLALTGLDPDMRYSFATSACRAGTTADYDDRYTIFTLTGADEATNASSPGTQTYLGNPEAVWFNTGKNDLEGYVARWTDIAPGADGAISVRAEAHPDANSGYKAYAFSVFRVEETAPAPVLHTLAVSVSGQGSVVRDPDHNFYAPGSSVTLTAEPAPGWEFVRWTGDLAGGANPEVLLVDSDKTVGAEFQEPVTGVQGPGPLRFALEACAPNPISRSALLRYSIARAGFVTLRVYDATGRHVATLVSGTQEAGRHDVAITEDLPSGIYFARLRSGGMEATRKIVFLR